MKWVSSMLSPSRCIAFLTILCLLPSCKGGLNTPTDSLRRVMADKVPDDRLFIAEDFNERQPLSVAILPFDNQTKEPEAGPLLRRLFYNNFSSLAYEDIELSRIDAALPKFDPAIAFDAPDTSKIAPQIQADAIIVGRVTKFETLYAGLYASFSVAFELKMIAPKENQVLWSVKHEETQRSGKVPLSPIGAIIAAATTVMDLSRYTMINTSNKLCQTSIETIPPSANLKGRSYPKIFTLVHDGVNRNIKKGDKLQIGVEGSPGLKAHFILSPRTTAVEMQEAESGSYIGTYIVREGEDLKDAQVVVTLTDEWNNTCRWEDTLGLVNLDGIAPQSPTGIKASGADGKVFLRWNPVDVADLAGYQVLRSLTPLSGYQDVGFTEFNRLEDADVSNDTTYYYRIVAQDKAGNQSQLLSGIPATPVPPGPTLVAGELGAETVWHPGGNPYFIDEEVVLPQGSRLRIEPGVLIKAAETTRFLIKGQLTVNGEANAPVLFSSDHEGGTWEGIVFDHADSEVRLMHFEITNAITGIRIIETSPAIDFGTIKGCTTGLVISGEKAAPQIKNLTIYRNKQTGVKSTDLAQPHLTASKIVYNGNAGIELTRSSGKFLANEISYNRIGVQMDQSSAVVGGNRIQFNTDTDLKSTGISVSGVKLDLNYFGPPEEISVFSTDSDSSINRLSVLKSHDWRGPHESIAVKAFPNDMKPNSDHTLVVNGSGAQPTPPRVEETSASSGEVEKQDEKPLEKKPSKDIASPLSTTSENTLDAFIQGVSLARKESYSEAITFLNQALKETSREAEVRFWLGFCHIQLGEINQALNQYNKAVRLDPQNTEYLLHLGSALHLKDEPQKAKLVYQEVLRRDPENQNAKTFLKLLEEPKP